MDWMWGLKEKEGQGDFLVSDFDNWINDVAIDRDENPEGKS